MKKEPVMKYPHPKRCELCDILVKEPVDWGFEPYCFMKFIPLDVWQWIQTHGCDSFRPVENEKLDNVSCRRHND
jgi:hypothetical protein